MQIRTALLGAALAAATLAGGCRQQARGPIVVSAIGSPPEVANPNLEPLDPPSALLIELTAQGLVRFDAAGQIEPALAQSWIVSDDGLRYTFRIARTKWSNGAPVTAEQVAARLRAAIGRASKNPLKPLLGAIAEVEAMTENVLEVSLRAPRPNLLQLLAQPEMGIIRNTQVAGPYGAKPRGDGSLLLTLPDEEDERPEEESGQGEIILRGESAAMAVARFDRGLADLVTGGTVGDLPIARAAGIPAAALRFDPAAGLFGLAFARTDGIAGDPEMRRALSMAIDRAALVAAFRVPDLLPRETILSPGVEELPAPALPDWAANPLPMRRADGARIVGAAGGEDQVRVRVAVPNGPGYRLVFAHLRRDWRAIGFEAEAVAAEAEADLRMIDSVAPANVATSYLRRFSCVSSPICSQEADAALQRAQSAPTRAERQTHLVEAERILTELAPFIPLAAPVRWSLVSPRLTGFQPNPFARRFLGSLVAARR
jgi:peptide/nickel transport system substrate-binding protein